MLKKWNRLLSFVLSASLVTTTFGSDMATARVYAVEDEIAAESSEQSDGDSVSGLSFAEEVKEEDAAEENQDEATKEETAEESSEEAESGENESKEEESNDKESETEESKDTESEEEQTKGEESEEGESEDKTEEKNEEAETKEDSESKESETENAASEGSSEEVKDAEGTAEEAKEAENADDAETTETADDTNTKEETVAGAEAEDEKSEVKAEEKAEEEDAEEKLIKVTYEATEGGSVSSESEEVDINDEDAEFEGSTATADEGYVFVNWTDADGEEVSDDVTFVPEDLEEDATFTANFEVEEVEEEEAEKNVVKITYKATEGGKVSPKSEKFDLNDKDAEIKGSTAEAEEGFVFVNWTDVDGKEVSDEETFVPEITGFGTSSEAADEDSAVEYTYTANFESEGPTYEMRFVESINVDGISISFYAAKEVLPDDVRFTVDTVSSSDEAQIADMIEEDLKAGQDKEVEVKTTKSFDINFYADSMKSDDNPDGKVQPKDGTVRVTFDAISNVDSEVKDAETSLAVYHVEDDMSGVNQEKVIENNSGESIAIEAEHFSTYTITIYHADYKNDGAVLKIQVRDINDSSKNIGANITHEFSSEYYKAYAVAEIANENKIAGYEFKKATIGTEGAAISHFELVPSASRGIQDSIGYSVNGGNDFYYINNNTVYFWYESAGIQENTLDFPVYYSADGINNLTYYNTQTISYTKDTTQIDGEENITVDGVGYSFYQAQVKDGQKWEQITGYVVEKELNGNLKLKAIYGNKTKELKSKQNPRENDFRFVYSNPNQKTVNWYVNGDKVKTTYVAVGDTPSYGDNNPSRTAKDVSLVFAGWAKTSDYGKDSILTELPKIREDDTVLDYYAVFTTQAYFYFLAVGQDYTKTSPSYYRHAGMGTVIIPDKYDGARWYEGQHDINKLVVSMPEKEAQKIGVSKQYPDYNEFWDFTLTPHTLLHAGTHEDYDQKSIYGKCFHLDCALSLETADMVTFTYYINDPQKGSYFLTKEHKKGDDSVSINQSVDTTKDRFTTDGEIYKSNIKVGTRNYSFDGWYTDVNCSVDAPDTVTTEISRTFYAEYEKNPFTVFIDYNCTELTNPDPFTKEEAQIVRTPTDKPNRDGYTLTGWKVYNQKGEQWEEFTYTDSFSMPANNIKFVAQWASKPQFQVTYQIVGNIRPEGITAPKDANSYYTGATVTVKGQLSANGYTFDGWYNNNNEKITGTTFIMPNSNVTLTGSFSKNSYTVTVKEKYYTLDNVEITDKAKTVAQETKQYQDEYSYTAADHTSEGYELITTTNPQTGKVEGDTEVIFKYKQKAYHVTYVVNKPKNVEVTTPVDTKGYAAGSDFTAAGLTIPTGYSFSEWKDEEKTIRRGATHKMPVGGITLTGTITANIDTAYKVEYYLADKTGNFGKAYKTVPGVGETGQVVGTDKYNETFDNYDIKTKEVIFVSRVGENSETVRHDATILGDGSLVIKVYYKRASFKITYKYDNAPEGTNPVEAPVDEELYTFGTEITEDILKTVTAPVGYTLLAWYPDRENRDLLKDGERLSSFTMPARDVELTAKFEAQSGIGYTIEYYQEVLDENDEYTEMLEGVKYKLKDSITDRKGTTGSTVTDYLTTYMGFDKTAEKYVSRVNREVKKTLDKPVVQGDGSLVIKVYYTRHAYNVSYAYSTTAPKGAPGLPNNGEAVSYKYGKTVVVAEKPELYGYAFNGWNVPPEVKETGKKENTILTVISKLIGIEPEQKTEYSFTMPAADVAITGYFDKNSYTVTVKEKYYTLNNVEITDKAKTVAQETKQYQDEYIYTAADHTSEGYELITTTNPQTGIVQGDTEVIFEYKQKAYYVTYVVNKPENVEVATPVDTKGYAAGSDFTAAGLTIPTGYDFSEWNVEEKTITRGATHKMPVGGITLTGSITASRDTEFTVKYFFEKANDDQKQYEQDSKLAADETKTGTTATVLSDEEINAFVKNIDGYTFSKVEFSTGSTPVILGDNSLVISIYYDRASYDVSYVVEGADADSIIPDVKVPETVSYKQGSNVDLAADLAVDGYVFSGWGTKDGVAIEDGKFVMPISNVEFIGVLVPITTLITFEYRMADGVEKPSNWDELAADLEKYNGDYVPGDELTLPERPTVSGYVFGEWQIEKADKEVGPLARAIAFAKDLLTLKVSAAGGIKVPDYDAVVYCVVAAEPKPEPAPEPDPEPSDDPETDETPDTPAPDPGEDDNPDPTPAPVDPAPTPAEETPVDPTPAPTEEVTPDTPVPAEEETPEEPTPAPAEETSEEPASAPTPADTDDDTPDPTPAETPDDPTPAPDADDDDTPDDAIGDTPADTTGGTPVIAPNGAPVNIPDALAPLAQVLGARREEEVSGNGASDGAAVLGARRGGTDDSTNTTARVFAIVVAAAAAISLMLTGKKKEEDEQA